MTELQEAAAAVIQGLRPTTRAAAVKLAAKLTPEAAEEIVRLGDQARASLKGMLAASAEAPRPQPADAATGPDDDTELAP